MQQSTAVYATVRHKQNLLKRPRFCLFYLGRIQIKNVNKVNWPSSQSTSGHLLPVKQSCVQKTNIKIARNRQIFFLVALKNKQTNGNIAVNKKRKEPCTEQEQKPN